MITNSAGLVDVRFFEAWVPVKEYYLYSKKDPNTNNTKKRSNIAASIKEVEIHIEKLKETYGEFNFAPFKTLYNPSNETEQLTYMLPNFITKLTDPLKMKNFNSDKKRKKQSSQETESKIFNTKKCRSRSSSDVSEDRSSSLIRSEGDEDLDLTSSSKTSLTSDKFDKPSTANYSSKEFDKYMEGYGTDEDSLVLNTEARKKIIKTNYDTDSDGDDEPLKSLKLNTSENGNSSKPSENITNPPQNYNKISEIVNKTNESPYKTDESNSSKLISELEKDKCFKDVDNLTRVIDSVAPGKQVEPQKQNSINSSRKKISVRPMSQLVQITKQKARKSFPNSPHKMSPSSVQFAFKVLSDYTPQTSQSITSTATTTASATTASTTTSFSKDSLMYIPSQTSPVMSNMTNVLLLSQNQPINLTQNRILEMVHPTLSSSSLLIQNSPLAISSQISTPSTSSCLTASNIETPPTTTTTTTNCPPLIPSNTSSTSNVFDDLNSQGVDSVVKAVGELFCKPAPKLKPRPPGPLSTFFDEGVSSTAGPTTKLVNSIAYRLSDYFRGLLKETLTDLGTNGSPESKIRSLELEIEAIKHQHSEEMLEVRKNITSMLKDVQKSLAEEKAKIIDDTRSQCEIERIRCVEEAKSKQWCAFCYKEAMFYCCWNTSYCDYSCQQKHWATHLKTCLNSSSCLDKSNTYSKTVQKHTFNNAITGPSIKLVESRSGVYEILGNHEPIYLAGKLVQPASMKVKAGQQSSMIAVSSSGASNNTTKTVYVTQKMPQT